nr:gliding motility lipoprotein GldD [Paucihalobacter ruber]
MLKNLLITISAVAILGCAEEYKPKPNAMLRLEYPKPVYKPSSLDLPFNFEKNLASKDIETIVVESDGKSIGLNIEYPQLKGTIYLTYKAVNNNLFDLIKDAQNLTQKHTVKADEIAEVVFENPNNNVYGMFYEIGGNAASQSQFYVTDSTKHFLSGSLYFYAKPNYDSIFPASEYLKKDIKRIMETLEWKD